MKCDFKNCTEDIDLKYFASEPNLRPLCDIHLECGCGICGDWEDDEDWEEDWHERIVRN